MEQMARLDVLIYAHDGRGLGHASRSIGVGMALRRLYPDLKVLFVSGCSLSQELIGAAPLD
jgi:predicted glycosyltransferase